MGELMRPKAHDSVRTVYTDFSLGEAIHDDGVASCVTEIEARKYLVTEVEPKFVHEDRHEKLYATHIHFRSLHSV